MLQFMIFWWVCAVTWGLYVYYSRNALGNIGAVLQAYMFKAHASNVEYMCTNAPGHIVDCSDLYEVYVLA